MDANKTKGPAIRKRTQIARTNQVMLIWVSGASVIVGIALVASIFLAQKLFFMEKVLSAKAQTVSTLQKDIKAVPKLEDSLRVLDTNSNLNNLKAHPDDQAVQVILDALPQDANSAALGGSLQNNLLVNGITGVTIKSLTVNPVVGVETGLGSDSTSSDSSDDGNVITFSFVADGPQTSMKQLLGNLEKSIRTINVLTISVTAQGGDKVEMSVTGEAYYQPSVQLQLQTKTIRPGSK